MEPQVYMKQALSSTVRVIWALLQTPQFPDADMRNLA